MNQLKEAARLFYNLTMADTTVFIRPPNAEKRDAIVAAGQALTTALALPDAEPFGYWDRTTHTFVSTEKRKEKFLPDEKSLREIRLTPLYTHAQPAIALEPISLTDVDSIAERFAASYASPHHFVMSVVWLRDAAAEIEKQRSRP